MSETPLAKHRHVNVPSLADDCMIRSVGTDGEARSVQFNFIARIVAWHIIASCNLFMRGHAPKHAAHECSGTQLTNGR